MQKNSAYNSQVERYVESVEQLGQKISALQENISKISDGKNISQITPDVQEAADTLKDNADIMNTQAETIENWISSAGETTIDTTTVDQGISDVRNNLFAAESSLSGIDYSTMDEGTRAAVQAALEAVQAARSSADGIDTSSLKGQPSDTSPLKKCSRYIEKYCIFHKYCRTEKRRVLFRV